MALIKQVVNVAVHWRLPGNNATNAANEMLKQIGLPDDLRKLFAALRVNGNNYEWSHPSGGWRPLKEADEIERQSVEEQISAARRNIVLKGRGLGENLIRVPDDNEYVFFRTDDAGAVEVLFTGWGFENSRISTPTPPTFGPNGKAHNVRIGLSIDNKLLPGRELSLSTGKLADRRVTADANGYFNLGVLKNGTSLRVVDIVSGKSFDFEVQPRQEDYVFDVTQKAVVEVCLMRDGSEALSDESVTVEYHGETRQLEWHAGSPLTTSFSLWTNEDATVTAMGLSESRPLNAGTNKFVLNVETPPAKVRIRMTHSDKSPYVSEKIEVSYGGKTRTVYTNASGEAQLSLPYVQGDNCCVTTSLGVKEEPLKSGGEVVLEFKEIKEEPLQANVRVRVLHHDGSPYVNEPVEVQYDGDTYNLTTDNSGECTIAMPYAKGRLCTVKSSVGADQRELSAAYDEVFEFKEVAPVVPPKMFDYDIQFIDSAGNPEKGVKVVFSQDGVDWPATLDSEGRTVLPNGTFKLDKDINVVMHFPDKRVYDIKFQLDANEIEYVIQTVPKTSSNWVLWLVLFLLLLGLLSLGMCALTDWSCFKLDPLVAPLFH